MSMMRQDQADLDALANPLNMARLEIVHELLALKSEGMNEVDLTTTFQKLTDKYDFELEDMRFIKNGYNGVTLNETTLTLTPLEETALNATDSQDAVALVFGGHFEDKYIFIHGIDRWHSWNEKFWEVDSRGGVMEEIRGIARKQNDKHRTGMASHNFFKGVENILRTDPIFSRTSDQFDQDHYLLNCPDGTWDLRTGEMHTHDPSDHITLITQNSPSIKGGDRFLQFMWEVTAENTETIAFLQTALGACLSGAVEEHYMLFLIGQSARNGKNTLGDTLLHILGDYACAIPSSTLMSQKNAEHKTEMMLFKGKRLVIASEIEEGAYWNEARIKEITGDAVITARYMRQDFVTFDRTHKLLVYGNHRPQMRSADRAMQARMQIVPFTVSFAGREDPDLPMKLKAEGDFILGWLMEGHRQWIAAGKKIKSCEVVKAELIDYVEMQATVEVWIEERCNLDNSEIWTKASVLFADYSEWKKEREEHPVSQSRFGEKLRDIGFQKKKSNGFQYGGICIHSTIPPSDSYGSQRG